MMSVGGAEMHKRELFLVSVVGSVSTAVLFACGVTAVGAESADASVDGMSSGTSGTPLGVPSSSSGASGSSGTTDAGGARSADEAGVTADGGIDPPGAGPGGNLTEIKCGATMCPIPAETCCVANLPGQGNRLYLCVVGATCPPIPDVSGTAALKCSTGANCPGGTVCCVRDTGGDRAASECKASCASDEAQLCNSAAPNTGCPESAACSNDNIGEWGDLPDGYATCGGKGND